MVALCFLCRVALVAVCVVVTLCSFVMIVVVGLLSGLGSWVCRLFGVGFALFLTFVVALVCVLYWFSGWSFAG